MSVTRLSLLERVRDASDQAAWGDFFVIYEPLLLSYVRRVNRDRGMSWSDHDVRDVVQEVFIKLYRSLPGFQLDHSKGRFRTWLWRITMNAMLDRIPGRKSHVEDEVPGQATAPRRPRVHDEGQVQLEQLAARDEEPDDWQAEYREAILQAVLIEVKGEIETANPNKWASFEQHGLRGRAAAEVASELGISANLVYQNTTRVLKRVREICLEKYEEGLADERRFLPA